MTIAACYLSAEGVVLGADSTTTMFVPNPDPNTGGAEHHYNFAQKVFQIGSDVSLGIAMWGLGNLATTSYRTLIARFADDLQANPQTSVAAIAERWNAAFWGAYSTEFSQVIQRVRQLVGQTVRTPQEENELAFCQQSFSGGFCIGGCCTGWTLAFWTRSKDRASGPGRAKSCWRWLFRTGWRSRSTCRSVKQLTGSTHRFTLRFRQ